AAEAQVAVAVEHHARLFGAPPHGFWLPECAFAPGLDEVLARHGIGYFFVDGPALLHASARPVRGAFAPLLCPSGVAAFGRDEECGRQVWSRAE
ncbi:hypothetical protein, partial [Flavihumibacter cheonanensis]|uniref:hypothetical protein n=1 Tax=Flavihumibacter cheonanensis TaxID=1442385 RepID=UPI001EF96735